MKTYILSYRCPNIITVEHQSFLSMEDLLEFAERYNLEIVDIESAEWEVVKLK